MKYFFSNKETQHINFKKLTEEDLNSESFKIEEELFVYPGTIESYSDTKDILKKIKRACGPNCVATFNFINIYQLFNDVAFHRLDIGMGHLVCKSIEKPFNVVAATNSLKEAGFSIRKTWLEDNSRFIRIECVNEN
jgi:hypothetical protein